MMMMMTMTIMMMITTTVMIVVIVLQNCTHSKYIYATTANKEKWRSKVPGTAVQSTCRPDVGFQDASRPGAGIMEPDDRQVTTVFTVQPSLHHRHSSNRLS